ncbi:hypothetical protein [Streptomyces griseosporeus]|uniref:hypothetical protein n=1 Tax=Streptomyces griseosporeus TaxID=1910 RepID=UPI0036F550B0
MTDQPLDLDAIEARIDAYRKHRDLGFACCSAHPVANAVPAMAAEIRRLRAELAKVRIAVLREVADECDEAGGKYAARALNDHASGAFTLMETFQRMANEAEYVATPCDPMVPCEDGGEPCHTHERLMAHGEGDHELCGPNCAQPTAAVAHVVADDSDDPGTLPAWLHWRFGTRGLYAQTWDALSDGDRAYWEHQARAVRRAVARGGFKAAAAARP